MRYILVLAAVGVALISASAPAVTIDLVPIGNPGNTGDTVTDPGGGIIGIFGRVTTSYQIGKFEVTNAQYVDFLNAKAATDTLNLYNTLMGMSTAGGIVRSGTPGSYTYAVKTSAPGVGLGGTNYTYGDKPVNYVNWYDSIRFANWMSNGQGSGSTETGAYTLLGNIETPSSADSITRNAGAPWFLPTENEWYKAAYYDSATSSYYDYPTASNSTPNNNLPSADTGNSANFKVGLDTTTGNTSYPHTPVGAYLLSDSPYGTFDQGGNVAEWNETLSAAGKRVRRGGDSNSLATNLSNATRESMLAIFEGNNTGFRLAAAAVSVGVAGDYNGNGVVDAADYVVWRDHLGTSFQLTNEVAGTTPGTVTNEDYAAWRARFGNTSGAGAGNSLASASVPEPETVMLLVISLITWCGTANRRRS